MFVIRLLDGEEIHAAENDKLTVNEHTGVLSVSRIDGFEEVTTHYSPSAWASVTHRVKGAVVRRPTGRRQQKVRRRPAPSGRQRDRALRAIPLGVCGLRLVLTGDVFDEHDRMANLVGVEDVRRQGVAAPVADAAICVDADATS